MTQVHTNSRADIVGTPLQLGDFLPERREVILNGQKYLAWVTTNQRYPRSIMAKLDRAAREYNDAIDPLQDIIGVDSEQAAEIVSANPEKQKALEEQPEAWDRYITTCVQLLIPNLLESEIELVPITALTKLLRELGYLPPENHTASNAEDAESQATPLTGDSSLQDSPGSTPGTTQTNS